MFKFIILFLISTYSIHTISSSESTGNSTYDVPCNIKYPFGDEEQFDCNVLDNSTNKATCNEEKSLQEIHGKCPTGESNETLVDPYVYCPDFPLVPAPHELIFSSSGKPAPEVQCKKCDLKLTSDNTAVILECFQCFDIPSLNREANMSLPPSYTTADDYLKDSLDFLNTYQWLYNYSNTHVLVNNVFSNIPIDWLGYFKELSNEDLNKLPLNGLKDDCPSSLKQFLNKIETLKPKDDFYFVEDQCKHEFPHNCGLNRKKLHEISALAPVIHEVCEANNVQGVIDIGSGLGYLSHHLHEKYNFTVLGIERSKTFIESAYRIQNKHHPSSKNQVTFVEHHINKDSVATIAHQALQTFSLLESCCIVGLHACADLSVTILNLFSKLDSVRCMVIMPCCYHRLELTKEDEDREFFVNFPVSTVLSGLFLETDAYRFLKRPFLRLACQQTKESFIKMTEEEHEKHSRDFMFRAVLQAVAESEKCQVRRLKRKSAKSRSSSADEDFEAYVNNLKNSYQLEKLDLSNGPLDDDAFLRKMREKWQSHKSDCYLVEVLSGLQAAIQSICENVVLLDRVEFLKEKGFSCRARKVTDDAVSPRCYALIAVKD